MLPVHLLIALVIIGVLALAYYAIRKLSDVAPTTIAAVLAALATLIGAIPFLIDAVRY
ncbi:hypothetical protein [Nonomuraea jabiensis]|uniref:hypothetical protein n=1 Tax=Nonomuraea jabiensis TaxID=882448 RepID=UPI003D72373F